VAETELAVLMDFVGRAGEVLLEDAVFTFEEGMEGETFTALVRLTLKAVLCGRGLMGLAATFSGGERDISGFLCSFISSLSSSELLNRLRVPARAGEGGFFAASITIDFGRYFGNAEDAAGFRGRSDDDLVTPAFCGAAGSAGFGCSSEEDFCAAIDARRRVIVFESGVPARFGACAGAGTSPIELRGVAPGLGLMALKRRELLSFVFLELLSASLPSLFITSASAFPMEARFNDCRIEALVDGLGRSSPPVELVSDGMFKERRETRSTNGS
jgi:hypothetical protein